MPRFARNRKSRVLRKSLNRETEIPASWPLIIYLCGNGFDFSFCYELARPQNCIFVAFGLSSWRQSFRDERPGYFMAMQCLLEYAWQAVILHYNLSGEWTSDVINLLGKSLPVECTLEFLYWRFFTLEVYCVGLHSRRFQIHLFHPKQKF